jgi:hypothetical protein
MKVNTRAGVARGHAIAPGAAIIKSSKITQGVVTQSTVQKLRTLGADADAIDFAARHVTRAQPAKS